MSAIDDLLARDGAQWRGLVDSQAPHAATPLPSQPPRARAPHRQAATSWRGPISVAASVALVAAAAILTVVLTRQPGANSAAGSPPTRVGLPPRNGYMRVVAGNGRQGYVRNSDLREPTPRNPRQALAWQTNRGRFSTVMPVYDRKDKIIGTFVSGDTAPRASTTCADRDGIGFTVTPPTNTTGYPTPTQAAAAVFSRYGLAGYTKPPNQQWHALALTDSTERVTAGPITLLAVKVSDGRWIIKSGQHCR